MSKEQLLRLLAQDEIDQVFHLLRESALSEIVLLEGQWHDLKADVRAGVLTQEQINVEEARIRRRLLELIEAGENPERTATRQTSGGKGHYRTAFILTAVLAVILSVFIFLKSRPPLATETTGPGTTASADQTDAGKKTGSRKLNVDTAPIELTADYVGTTGYQILEAELSDKNPDHFTLSVRLRCIRPPYGQGISEATLHLTHGAEEKAPFKVEFPFVKAKTTEEGVLQFEVPKSWKDAALVIYHGAVEPFSKAEIPLRF